MSIVERAILVLGWVSTPDMVLTLRGGGGLFLASLLVGLSGTMLALP